MTQINRTANRDVPLKLTDACSLRTMVTPKPLWLANKPKILFTLCVSEACVQEGAKVNCFGEPHLES